MADILIRGMEMPKYITRADIGFDAGGNPLCLVYHKDGTEPDIYDIVPLPEGHGRLIDETELIAKLVCHCKDLRKLSTKTIGETIGLCATIVPAEGGGENGR